MSIIIGCKKSIPGNSAVKWFLKTLRLRYTLSTLATALRAGLGDARWSDGSGPIGHRNNNKVQPHSVALSAFKRRSEEFQFSIFFPIKSFVITRREEGRLVARKYLPVINAASGGLASSTGNPENYLLYQSRW